MSRSSPIATSGLPHTLLAAFACAAILLASFEDEALLAASGAAIAGHELLPDSGQPDAWDGFPDLCRQVKTQTPDNRPSDEATLIERVDQQSFRPAICNGGTLPLLRTSGSPRRIFLCVWLI